MWYSWKAPVLQSIVLAAGVDFKLLFLFYLSMYILVYFTLRSN